MVSVRYMTDSANRDESKPRHRLLVDGREEAVIAYPASGVDQWSNAFARVPLKAGSNRIALTPPESQGRRKSKLVVDSLDVILIPGR